MENWIDNLPPDLTLRELETAYILATLERCHGNRLRTVRKLGICVRTLHQKIIKMRDAGIAVPEAPVPAAGILNVCAEPEETILNSVPDVPVAND